MLPRGHCHSKSKYPYLLGNLNHYIATNWRYGPPTPFPAAHEIREAMLCLQLPQYWRKAAPAALRFQPSYKILHPESKGLLEFKKLLSLA